MPSEQATIDLPRRHGASLTGTFLEGRYRLLRRLGQGGAAEVYLAEQPSLNRKVAVKVVRSDIRGTIRTEYEVRFEQEAAAAAALRHPNLVRVFDLGRAPNIGPYMVMEYLPGQTLGERLDEGPLDPDEAIRVVTALARGLAHAHDHGHIHRDVKPSNVMLVGEMPVLMDFGLVRVIGQSGMTEPGTLMGTPTYIAPEQARADPGIDGRVDQYSLGVVLFHCLTGAPPFKGDALESVVTQHLQSRVPTARIDGEPVDSALQAVIERAMAKRPDDRFPAMDDFADALDPAVHTEPPRRGIVGGLTIALAISTLVAGFAGLPDPPPRIVTLPAPEPIVVVTPAPDPVLFVGPLEASVVPIEPAEPEKPVAVPVELVPEPAAANPHVVAHGADIRLLDGSGTAFSTDTVPPGTYTVLARFPGGEPVRAGQIDVPDGGVVLDCNPLFLKCVPR